MQVLFQCPACHQFRSSSASAEHGVIACGACDWTKPIAAGSVVSGQPHQCLVCGCHDLWRQKDFPQKLGLAMVALGAILSTIAFSLYMPLTALGILLGFAMVDMLLFAFMKDVLVCYACHARYKDAVLPDDHPRFNLETAERYRQEAARIQDSRRPANSTS